MRKIAIQIINEKNELVCIFDKENSIELAQQMCSKGSGLRWETVSEKTQSLPMSTEDDANLIGFVDRMCIHCHQKYGYHGKISQPLACTRCGCLQEYTPEQASLFAPDFSDAPGPNSDRVEDFVCPLGKHKGKQFGQILIDNPGYISWLSQQEWLRHDLREVVDEMMKRYAHEIEEGQKVERERFFQNRRR